MNVRSELVFCFDAANGVRITLIPLVEAHDFEFACELRLEVMGIERNTDDVFLDHKISVFGVFPVFHFVKLLSILCNEISKSPRGSVEFHNCGAINILRCWKNIREQNLCTLEPLSFHGAIRFPLENLLRSVV